MNVRINISKETETNLKKKKVMMAYINKRINLFESVSRMCDNRYLNNLNTT
jgi:hypothetical protein